MGYHPRIESEELASLATIRSRNSEVWLINNIGLEEAVLGYAAKYGSRYGVKLYALGIEGNHIHSLGRYPNSNRAGFQRDFNSSVARAIPRYVKEYPGGKLWARRYSSEFVPDPEDIEEYFFYIVLQPVKDGLVEKISEYPGYNCFSDAVRGIKRKFKVVNWAAYNDRRRWDLTAKLKDFIEVVELKFERLPGYEDMEAKEYKDLMHRKLEERRLKIVAKRGKPAAGVSVIKSKRPGSLPHRTKKSNILSHRPRILCVSNERRAAYKTWYFDIYFSYKDCSQRFRQGDMNVKFPPGTYRPPTFTCKALPVEMQIL